MGGGLLDVLGAVVDEEDLAFAQQLTADRRSHLPVLVPADVGEHRMAILRRGRQGRHLPDPGHRHLQGARNRGRRHGEHVDVGAQRLERLLVLNAETLLLIDDHEPQVLELHLTGKQPVGADDEVEAAVFEVVLRLLRIGWGLEAGESADGDGEAGVAFGEGVEVLLDEQGRRHEHGNLLAVLDRLERRTHRHLGLAVAHVAADEPVHGDRLLHIGFDFIDGGELVGGLHVVEGVFKLTLPRGVRAEGVPGGGAAGRIQVDELAGDLLDRSAGFRLRLRPVRTAHLVHRR